MNAGRLWRTVRHLRAVQATNRLTRRLTPAHPDLRPAPPVRSPQRQLVPLAPHPPCLTGPETVTLLNEPGTVASSDDWTAADRDRLWLYHLHYFDDLTATDAVARLAWQKALLVRWMAEHPPGTAPGWEPYPVSRRLPNWIAWMLLHGDRDPALLDSLAVQARWLAKRIEHHLQGNHLIANAKALLFAGWFFAGEEADGWRAAGDALLARELDRQILDDGGHEERSPMYHALVLEDALDVLNLLRSHEAPTPAWRDRIPAMLGWLGRLTHPDGGIALFNDAAHGIATAPADLFAYAERLGFRPPPSPSAAEWLPTTGIARLARGSAVLFADGGPIGPDHQPGHAHADTLGFELSLRGRRLLVDTGVSQYGASAERLRQRGTAAHNTVAVDGENSSEVWGGFRVGRRARIREAGLQAPADGPPVFSALHDGYRHRGVLHRRTWTLGPTRLRIEDELTGRGTHALALALHLAPGIEPVR
ncbi:MAG: heparinase II/III family protein, partial [Planctomycetota bacterium]